MEIKDINKINRLEVINHSNNNYPIGRLVTVHRELGDFRVIHLELQDKDKTLKIFIQWAVELRTVVNAI